MRVWQGRVWQRRVWQNHSWKQQVWRIRGWRDAARSGAWLSPERVRGYAMLLLIAQLLVRLFWNSGAASWFVSEVPPASSDFASFYAAGMLADAGMPALAYDQAVRYAAEQQATVPGIPYNYFYYPPTFLLLCALLAKLPYALAFTALQGVPLLAGVAMARRILVGAPLVVLLGFPPLWWALGTGQNALLTAALLAGGTLLVDRRPLLAGLLFGALCYKPHFGLLLPVALLAGGHWRAVLGAALAVAGLVVTSLLAFGWGTWQAFLHAAAGADAVYATAGSIDMAGLTSPYGLVLTLGGPLWLALAVQGPAMLAAAAAVGIVWRRGGPLPVRAAVLLAAIPIAVPILMFYDLMLLGIAMLWLMQAGRTIGFPAWQRSALFVLFVLPLWSGNIGPRQLLIPPLTAALGLGLALRQARPGLCAGSAQALGTSPADTSASAAAARAVAPEAGYVFASMSRRPRRAT